MHAEGRSFGGLARAAESGGQADDVPRPLAHDDHVVLGLAAGVFLEVVDFVVLIDDFGPN